MSKRSNYNTKQKEQLFEYVKNKKEEFTIKEIYDAFNRNIGLSTIYRFIDKLVDDGMLEKRIGSDQSCYFTYLEECDCLNHYYLKCHTCGKIIHVDCDCINELSSHIFLKHNFNIDLNNIIIYGYCDKCRRNNI